MLVLVLVALVVLRSENELDEVGGRALARGWGLVGEGARLENEKDADDEARLVGEGARVVSVELEGPGEANRALLGREGGREGALFDDSRAGLEGEGGRDEAREMRRCGRRRGAGRGGDGASCKLLEGA